ncbi:MAG: glycosyltransferase family 39 protein [Anaerolineae bacterium]
MRIEQPKFANAIWALLALFLVLGSWYTIALPIFEGADEISHFRVIEFIADNRSLPHIIQDKEAVGHEAGQPPLYYALLAPFVAPLDRSDFDEVVRQNPHFLHLNSTSIWYHLQPISGRLYGVTGAVVLARFISLLLGCVTIWCTWATALTVFDGHKHKQELSLLSAGFVALNPQFLAISGSINNDNLIIAFCSLALLLVTRWHAENRQHSANRPLLIGLVIGLAVLSKISAIAFGGVIAVVLLMRLSQKERLWAIVKDGLLVTTGFLTATGWWFWRNQTLYGDPLGLEALSIAHEGTYRDVALTAAETLSESQLLLKTFWLFPGNGTLFGPSWFYWVINIACLIGLIGLVSTFFSKKSSSKQKKHATLLATWVVLILGLLFYWISTVGATSQGRLLYPALSAIAVLIMLGFQKLGIFGRILAWSTIVFLLVSAVLTPPFVIQPAFASPEKMAANAEYPNSQNSDPLIPEINLLGHEVINPNVSIGERPKVRLFWEASAPVPDSYYVTLHFVDTAGTQVSRYEGYPFSGRYPTTLWAVNEPFVDEIELPPITENAVGGLATVFVELTSWRGDRSTELQPLTQKFKVRLAETPADPEVITDVTYGSLANLNGYTLDQSDQLSLRTYWEAIEPDGSDQTVFVHLIDAKGELVAQGDNRPRNGTYPTSFWEKGELIIDQYNIPLAGLNPGSYRLSIGFYNPETGTRLPVNSQGQVQNSGFSISIDLK